MKFKDVLAIGEFEPRKEAYVPPLFEADEWVDSPQPHYRGSKGLSSYGNIFPGLNLYKMNKVLGANTFSWLSDTYVDSEYLYECQRGTITNTMS
jgi:hypothetical protein